jgi:hypothetical protein
VKAAERLAIPRDPQIEGQHFAADTATSLHDGARQTERLFAHPRSDTHCDSHCRTAGQTPAARL